MREMRDSGVEWIGEIPKDWNCCKQKYRFTLINGRAFKDNEFEEDGTYRILRVGNLFSNPVWYSSSLELEPDKYCEKGDLIYAWSMSYGPYIWNEEKVIYHYHIWKTKLVSDMDKMFSYYYLQALTESIKSQTHETTMGFVTMGIMNNFVLNDKNGMCPKYYLYMMQMCYSARIFYGLGQGVSGMGRWRLQADKPDSWIMCRH